MGIENENENENKRAKIVRYTDLPNGYLSRYNPETNILEIDRTLREFLAPSTRNRLDCSEAKYTFLEEVPGGIVFRSVY